MPKKLEVLVKFSHGPDGFFLKWFMTYFGIPNLPGWGTIGFSFWLLEWFVQPLGEQGHTRRDRVPRVAPCAAVLSLVPDQSAGGPRGPPRQGDFGTPSRAGDSRRRPASQLVGVAGRTRRCSRRRGQVGFPRVIAKSAPAVAELGRLPKWRSDGQIKLPPKIRK